MIQKIRCVIIEILTSAHDKVESECVVETTGTMN